ncbi:hypothetical protein POK33_39500 [Burkholderia cenocepacia]|uniref:hypothetical protein n=1 Tax=Burkholderia cenocepacia TaxID=95486 RepID=UPI0023B88711|nr:hypothetical protein [Burkholderia cenocepacia]MDF0506841.1 hypothetical protein [Burkholderia cenocepacia]
MEASRTVTLKHPNSMDCTVFRRVLKRTAPDGGSVGGLPTLGGLAVLSPEDEPEYDYEPLGEAKILITSRFDGDVDLSDRMDSLPPDVSLQEALIEAIEVPGFTPKKYDLVGVMPGGGVLIGFEVVGTTSSVGIYPYVTKYVIAPRDKLHDLGPWSEP